MLTKRNIFLMALLASVMILNIYFRLYPAYFPQFKSSAKAIAARQIKNVVQCEDEMGERNDSLDARTEKIYQNLKASYQDVNRQTYLLEVDSYGWARYVRNVIEHGHPGDSIKNGKFWDDLSAYPEGKQVKDSILFIYLSAYLYSLFNIFMPIPLETFLFYLPLFYACLFLILLFLFCRNMATSEAGLLAVVLVGLCPLFLQRSCAGWFDTDPVNSIFLLAVLWAMVEYFSSANYKDLLKNSFILISIMGLFRFFWYGWWVSLVMFFIYLVVDTIIFILGLLRRKGGCIFPPVMVVSWGILVLLFIIYLSFNSREGIVYAIKTAFYSKFYLGTIFSDFYWPAVLGTVSEFRFSWLNLERLTFSRYFMTFGFFSLFTLFFSQYKRYAKGLCIFALFFFVITVTMGMRFAYFFWFALGIAVALVIVIIFKRVRGLTLYKNTFCRFFIFIVSIVVLFSLGFSLCANSAKTMSGVFPMMNDRWYNALMKVSQVTPEKSVVITWWDYGNWVKFYSRRATVFDSNHQSSFAARFISAALFSSDNRHALLALNIAARSQAYSMPRYVKDWLPMMRRLAILEPSNGDLGYLHYQEKNTAPLYLFLDRSILHKAAPISFFGLCNMERFLGVQSRQWWCESAFKGDLSLYGEDFIAAREMVNKRDMRSLSLDYFASMATFSPFSITGTEKDGFIDFPGLFFVDKASLNARSFARHRSNTVENVALFDGANLSFNKNKCIVKKPCFLFYKTSDKWRAVRMSDFSILRSLMASIFFMDGYGFNDFSKVIADADDGFYLYKVKSDE